MCVRNNAASVRYPLKRSAVTPLGWPARGGRAGEDGAHDGRGSDSQGQAREPYWQRNEAINNDAFSQRLHGYTQRKSLSLIFLFISVKLSLTHSRTLLYLIERFILPDHQQTTRSDG